MPERMMISGPKRNLGWISLGLIVQTGIATNARDRSRQANRSNASARQTSSTDYSPCFAAAYSSFL